MGKNSSVSSYNLFYNNIIIDEPTNRDINYCEESDDKVKYKFSSSWAESPFFWVIFSLNAANIFGFTHFDDNKSEGLSIIIYLLLLLIIGFPVLLIETLVSQFSRKRPIELWDSLPLIGKGLALTQCIITIIQSIVYTFFTATALRILFNTIESLINSNEAFVFPWIKYDNECTALTNDSSNILKLRLSNNSLTCLKQPLSEMYLLTDIWQLTNFENSLNDWNIESFCWKFASFICAIQVFIFLTTLRSVERIMRYISVLILTYSTLVFIGLLIIIGLQNEFSALKDYFITTFENGFEAMRESKNWLKILSHVVTSLYLAIGFIPHFGHQIDFKHTKTYRNNMIALISNLLVFILLRLLSSISVFYNESFQTQKVQSIGHQIVLPFSIYIIICDALTFLSDNLNQTVVISLTIAFLLAIVLIGLQTIVLLRETTIGFFISREEDNSSKHLTVKIIVTLVLLSSLLLATNRGPTIVTILYTYGIVTPVIVCILLQLIILLWLYGIRTFQSDIHFMLDSVIPLPIRMSWVFFTPIALIGIYVAFLIQTKFWTHISLIKVILISFILIPIPLSVIVNLIKAPAYTLKERFKHIMNTSSDWGPTIPFYRSLWLYKNKIALDNLQLIEAKRHAFDTSRKSITGRKSTTTNNL